MDFANIIREEAVLFLLDLPKGEEVSILAQKKKDGQYWLNEAHCSHGIDIKQKKMYLFLFSSLSEDSGIRRG